MDAEKKSTTVAVFGAGSIGERHIGVLLEAGYRDIVVFRTRNLPLRAIDPAAIAVVTSLDDLAARRPAAAIICTPTAQHQQQALWCIRQGIHTLVEKPLATDTAELEPLREALQGSGAYLQVAYMLRYHPAMIAIRDLVQRGTYGPLLYFHTHWGEYLPDWHLWEDYRESYAARASLGGGAALTLSHDLDVVNFWLDALPAATSRLSSHAGKLEVDVDSASDFLLRYPSGVTGHVHVNFFQKKPRREYHLVFEDALVTYFYFENRLVIKTKESTEEISYDQFERNDMFRDQLADFMTTAAGAHRPEELEARALQNLASSDAILHMLRTNDAPKNI